MTTTMNTGAASLSDEQREQLNLIEHCDPSWLIRHIEEDTAYDGPLVARVFELAKERARAILATPAPQADAAIAAGGAQEADPVTYMTEDEARDWSWKQVKNDVGTEGWTAGDSNNYFGFFCWGWNTRGQYERQRPKIAAPLPRAAATVEPAADTVSLTGAQLLEAFQFVAPDHPNDADQLECEVTIQRGNGHDGPGLYCWITEYPEEGAIRLDADPAAASNGEQA